MRSGARLPCPTPLGSGSRSDRPTRLFRRCPCRERGWLICHKVIHRFMPYINVRLKSSMTLCNNSRARNPLMHNQLLLRRLRTYRCAVDSGQNIERTNNGPFSWYFCAGFGLNFSHLFSCGPDSLDIPEANNKLLLNHMFSYLWEADQERIV